MKHFLSHMTFIVVSVCECPTISIQKQQKQKKGQTASRYAYELCQLDCWSMKKNTTKNNNNSIQSLTKFLATDS